MRVLRRLNPVRGNLQKAVADAGAPNVLTADLLQMHAQLYHFDKLQMVAVSDAGLKTLLHQLRATAVLDPFRFWLVGSRLEPGKDWSDVDLVLAPRTQSTVSDESVERALWHCRNFGLHGGGESGSSHQCCLIDPCFRCTGPALEQVPLEPQTVLQTSKLFSPKLAKLTAEGRIKQYRRFGRCSIEYLRKAGDTDYYAKLPRLDGSGASYLRPAVEIT